MSSGWADTETDAPRTQAAQDGAIINPLLAAHVRRQMCLDLSPLLIAQPKQTLSHDPTPAIKERESKNHQPIRDATALFRVKTLKALSSGWRRAFLIMINAVRAALNSIRVD
jgi:hypothetical protein